METDIVLTLEAVFAGWPEITERLGMGQKFNAYACALGDDDRDFQWLICIGPVTNAFPIIETDDPARANLIVDALRFAAQQTPALCVAGPGGVMVFRDEEGVPVNG